MDPEFHTEGGAGSRQPRTFSDWLVPAVIFAFCAVVIHLALHLDEAPAIVIGEAMQPRQFNFDTGFGARGTSV